MSDSRNDVVSQKSQAVARSENRDALVLSENLKMFVACHKGISFCSQRHDQNPIIIRIAASGLVSLISASAFTAWRISPASDGLSFALETSFSSSSFRMKRETMMRTRQRPASYNPAQTPCAQPFCGNAPRIPDSCFPSVSEFVSSRPTFITLQCLVGGSGAGSP